MPKRALSEVLEEGRLLVAGAKENLSALERRGVDATTLAALTESLSAIAKLNAEQEALKSKLKLKTAELEAEVERFQALHNDLRKLAKMTLPRTAWVGLGIRDKQ